MLYLELLESQKPDRASSAPWQKIAIAGLIALQTILPGCSQLEKPKSESFYAGTTAPRRQEFRWSNGKSPKTLDPARAAAPPETDLVRAVFEGLTEVDAKTLKEKPAAAERWTASEDFKTWTFYLRSNAYWSNGKAVTSDDFVRSWRRLGELGESVPHHDLLTNIVGFPLKKKDVAAPTTESLQNSNGRDIAPPLQSPLPPRAQPAEQNTNSITTGPAPAPFGVSAPDARTVQVLLIAPDRDFPKLVANAIFRPIFNSGKDLGEKSLNADVVTNGAFRVAEVNAGGVSLERSETYWNRDTVKLERVTFVSTENAEQALAAYKSGEIDAVTNADFEALALKLLEPFQDFRRRTHAALNFYEINHEKSPFDDRRVREALAISIERERLTEGEMEGLTQPALSFLPFSSGGDVKIAQDKEKARDLLDEAGFPNGKDFPVIKLVVNRNDTQQRVARAVARMWKQNLNLETEIVIKENAELEQARTVGDFDLIRRGVVFATADELMSILSILKPATHSADTVPTRSADIGVQARDPLPSAENASPEGNARHVESPDVTMSEENAIYELWAIPLYFPTTYSLVKPYVSGFEMNSLDAPSLSDVSIDADWQTK